jgi:hypothetical protein
VHKISAMSFNSDDLVCEIETHVKVIEEGVSQKKILLDKIWLVNDYYTEETDS